MGRRIQITESQLRYIIENIDRIDEQGEGDLSGQRKPQKGKNNNKTKSSSTIPNWENGTSGVLDITRGIHGKPAAINVSVNDSVYDIWIGSKALGVVPLPKGPGKKSTPWELPSLKLDGNGTLPFCDNMVIPNWGEFPQAKQTFDNLVNKLVDFISRGGFDYIKTIQIQGTADSAKPTDSPGCGASDLDHPGAHWNGATTDEERNLYLANQRAKSYAQAIVNAVKEKTKKDLSSKFKFIDGISYLGQGESKRGAQWRSINMNIKADDIPSQEGKDIYPDGMSELIQAGDKVVGMPIWVNGKYYGPIPAIKSVNYGTLVVPKNIKVNLGIKEVNTNDILDQLFDTYVAGNYNGSPTVSAKIEGDKLFVNNKLVGEIRRPSEQAQQGDAGLKGGPDLPILVAGDYENNGSKPFIVKGKDFGDVQAINHLWFDFH